MSSSQLAERARPWLDTGSTTQGLAETIARLHVALCDTEPLVWRLIDVPVVAGLKIIHDTIQAATGSLDYHLWDFEGGVRLYGLALKQALMLHIVQV